MVVEVESREGCSIRTGIDREYGDLLDAAEVRLDVIDKLDRGGGN